MTLVINPKKSIEIEKSNIIKGVWLSCRMIYSDEGLKGFYRGLVASVYRNIAASAVYFSALDYFN
jgi:solute carrier family 25 protein 38